MSSLIEEKCDIKTLWKITVFSTFWKNFRVDANQSLGVDCFSRWSHHRGKRNIVPQSPSFSYHVCVEPWTSLCGWNIHDKQFPCVGGGPEDLWEPSHVWLYRFKKIYLNYTCKSFHYNVFAVFGTASSITNSFHFNAGISSPRLWLMLILKHGIKCCLKC